MTDIYRRYVLTVNRLYRIYRDNGARKAFLIPTRNKTHRKQCPNKRDRLAARLRPTGLELQPTKTKVWAPNMEHVMAHPRLAHLERQNPSEGGLLIVGEALGAEDEEAQVLGTSPFVHAHLRKIADLVAQDCVRIQHLPEHLVAQEAGMQLGFALLQRTLPSRILHLLRGQATEHTAELCETLTTHMHTVHAAELADTLRLMLPTGAWRTSPSQQEGWAYLTYRPWPWRRARRPWPPSRMKVS